MKDSPAGDDPSSESADGAHDELLISLADDFAARHRRGEHPTIEEYVQQHPHLAAEIRDLFPAMALMEEPGLSPLADIVPASERPGVVVGRYKLLERLGEGGFGVVFLAEQQHPVRRKVALKVIKPGLDTQQVIARFQAERQALAMMDHENIARVLDAGATDSGRPYIVMELVHGVPITDYCDRNHLAPRQRLELFVRVCRAVQHAHTKGIIHRDLKPTNVLVAVHDGRPVPKVIDFGVAKATSQQQLTDGTLFTNVAQIVGTPLYMSPEQAEMTGQDVDTRSDVYSLGVVLYELLTGTTPVNMERLKRAGFDEVRRIIREEEPPRPSTRISALSGQLAPASVERRADLKKLGHLVRGELDWIVMKALEKNRDRRYETVIGLAADVERYLNDESVQACPPSATYRAKKLLRRHKGPVIAATLVVVALVAGIIGTTWGMIRATDAEYRARTEVFYKDMAVERAERFRFAEEVRTQAASSVQSEAQRALALPDIELAQEWDDTDPTGNISLTFAGTDVRYARVSQQGAVAICRVANGIEVVVTLLPAFGKPAIQGPWMSPDGRFVAYSHSGLPDGSTAVLRVWKLDGPAPTVLLDDPVRTGMSGLVFHAEGGKLAFFSGEAGVAVYDLNAGRRVRTLPLGSVTAMAFHPRDNRLAIASGDHLRIFNCETGVELPSLHPDSAGSVRCLAWHPDGRHIAIASEDRKIHLCDADSAAEVMPAWGADTEFTTSFAFNRSGDRLVSSNEIGETRLWEVSTGRPLLTIPTRISRDQAFNGDDRLLGFSRANGKIQIWRVAWGREVRVLRRRGLNVPTSMTCGVLDPTGRVFAVLVATDWLTFFDVINGEELASVRTRDYTAHPFGYDSAGRLFTSGIDGVLVWPIGPDPTRPGSQRVGPPQPLLPGLKPGGIGVFGGSSISRDGRVLTICDELSTRLVHRDHSNQVLRLGPQYDVQSSAVSPDGRWVVTSSIAFNGRDSSTRIWDGKAGAHVFDLPLTGRAEAKFSPDGRWLATFDRIGSQLWKVGTWQKGVQVPGEVAFDPSSRWLAVGGFLGGIRLMRIENGQEVGWVSGPDQVRYSPVCFTPDETRLLATGWNERAMYVWNLRSITEQLQAIGHGWEWSPSSPEAPDPRDRLHLTVDAGTVAHQGPSATP